MLHHLPKVMFISTTYSPFFDLLLFMELYESLYLWPWVSKKDDNDIHNDNDYDNNKWTVNCKCKVINNINTNGKGPYKCDFFFNAIFILYNINTNNKDTNKYDFLKIN